MKKFLPWVGGKASAATRIAEILPEHTCYAEPFAGGAAVLFAKRPSRVEVLNDKNGELVNLFRVVQRHPEAFLKELGLVVASREHYEDCWAQPGLTDIERASRFFYRIRHTYAAMPHLRAFAYGVTHHRGYIDPDRVRADVLTIHDRLRKVVLECVEFEDVIRRYDRATTVFYCDPPYYGVKGLYGPGFDLGEDGHVRLAESLKGLRGRFVLSINGHPFIRQLYKWAKVGRLRFGYTTGRNTATTKKKRKAATELLIRNF